MKLKKNKSEKKSVENYQKLFLCNRKKTSYYTTK